MSAIDALRRQEANVVSARPDASRSSRRFGEDLADAVDRTVESDDPTEQQVAELAATTDPTNATDTGDPTSTAVVGVSTPGAPLSTGGVPVEPFPSSGVVEVAGGPRINNGGSCSCCTPGVLRGLSDEIAAIPGGPPVEAFGAALPPSLPPPSSPPALAPPSGPPVPLGPPAQPLPPPVPGAVPSPVLDGAVDLLEPTVTEPTEASESSAPDPTAPAPAVMAAADPAPTVPVQGVAPTTELPPAVPAPNAPAVTAGIAVAASGALTGATIAPVLDPGSTAADAGTDDEAPPEDTGPTGPTSRSLSAADLSTTTAASATTSGAATTAGSSPLSGPSVSEGVLRSEQVRVMRELAPNREVQRLAFELDGARVAVRFDQDGAKVNVVADPGNRLGSDWANNVQRTLDAGARQGSTFQQRDADGGRRQRQGHDRTPAADERTAADFAARLGAIERG